MTKSAPPVGRVSRRLMLPLVVPVLSFAAGPRLGAQAPPATRVAKGRHVDLDSAGDVWIGFSGQLRTRAESWTNFNFGTPATANANDTFVLNRVLLGADLHAGHHVRVFVQGKSSTSSDRALLGGRRVTDVDEADVQQAFGELDASRLAGGTLSVRVGRQDITLGRERLVSTADWANTRRTFQGALGSITTATASLTALWARPVLVEKYALNSADSATSIYGLYATQRLQALDAGLDAYWLRLERDGAAFNGTTGHEARHTLGARVWGPLRPSAGFDFDAEGAGQFGTIADTKRIHAAFFAGQLGYNVPRWRASRFYLGADYGSGDGAPGGNVGTFNALFPNPHGYLGFIDVIGRQNALDLSAGASTTRLWAALTGQVDVHRFTRASASDGIYNKLGAPLARTGTLSRLPTGVGTELDLTLRYPVDQYLLLSSGASAFWPGPFIEQSGPSRTIGFLYVAGQYTL